MTITGNVTIGKGVQLKGTVIIVCNDGDKIDIPNGAILENVVVTGNLTILNIKRKANISQRIDNQKSKYLFNCEYKRKTK